jgi:hypothetical protein
MVKEKILGVIPYHLTCSSTNERLTASSRIRFGRHFKKIGVKREDIQINTLANTCQIIFAR